MAADIEDDVEFKIGSLNASIIEDIALVQMTIFGK